MHYSCPFRFPSSVYNGRLDIGKFQPQNFTLWISKGKRKNRNGRLLTQSNNRVIFFHKILTCFLIEMEQQQCNFCFARFCFSRFRGSTVPFVKKTAEMEESFFIACYKSRKLSTTLYRINMFFVAISDSFPAQHQYSYRFYTEKIV